MRRTFDFNGVLLDLDSITSIQRFDISVDFGEVTGTFNYSRDGTNHTMTTDLCKVDYRTTEAELKTWYLRTYTATLKEPINDVQHYMTRPRVVEYIELCTKFIAAWVDYKESTK